MAAIDTGLARVKCVAMRGPSHHQYSAYRIERLRRGAIRRSHFTRAWERFMDLPSCRSTPTPSISRRHLIRGFRVMLDSDLAELYGVETKVLNQAVARNAARFPADFAFRLTVDEVTNLRSQIVTSSLHGGHRYAPRVFTEHGVAMLSSVLKSRRAIDVNIAIVRAFVHLREMLTTHTDLTRRIDELEQRYDGNFAAVFDAIRDLTSPFADEERRGRIGFITDQDTSGSAGGATSNSAVRPRSGPGAPRSSSRRGSASVSTW